ncbi:MAG: manganese transporter permease [Verrucomicrobiota bacterium]
MTQPAGQPIAARWWTFTKERFPPTSHLPMVLTFTLANAAMACRLLAVPFSPAKFCVVVLVSLLFFFRLRCFDEIKDYQVDLKLNPTRPLARGLLALGQVKVVILALAVLELALAAALGAAALAAHAVAVGYSFLMYREFFIGRWLRPRLTTYAVTHTFVSILQGWSIAVQMTGVPLTRFTGFMLLFGPVNWMLFNVFEFARKTFAPEEERPRADSYSSLFKPLGAALLCTSQIVIALGLLAALPRGSLAGFGWLVGPAWLAQALLALLPLGTAGFYVAHPEPVMARRYRAVLGAYLVLFYALLAWQGLAEAG